MNNQETCFSSVNAIEADFDDQARGLDPVGKEAKGVYHAELFVSRPLADIGMAGLYDIVQVAGGYPMLAALEVSN